MKSYDVTIEMIDLSLDFIVVMFILRYFTNMTKFGFFFRLDLTESRSLGRGTSWCFDKTRRGMYYNGLISYKNIHLKNYTTISHTGELPPSY